MGTHFSVFETSSVSAPVSAPASEPRQRHESTTDSTQAQTQVQAQTQAQPPYNVYESMGCVATLHKLWDTLECPILLLENMEHDGYIDYIDFIETSALTESIMKGTDESGRRFICLRFTIEYVDDGTGTVKAKPPQTHYVTLFQRYTDNKYYWQSSNLVGDPHLEVFPSVQFGTQQLIETLIRTGTYVYQVKDTYLGLGAKAGAIFRIL